MPAGAGPERDAGGAGAGAATTDDDLLGNGQSAAAGGGLTGVAAFGLGLGRAAALEQVGGDARIGGGLAAAPAAGGSRGGSRFRLRLLAGRLGSLEEVLRDLGHAVLTPFSDSLPSNTDHSGPEMPPSLRTRQKWMAMKMTMMNGKKSTCSTYHRNNVSGPISAPPSSTNRTCDPSTGV